MRNEAESFARRFLGRYQISWQYVATLAAKGKFVSTTARGSSNWMNCAAEHELWWRLAIEKFDAGHPAKLSSTAAKNNSVSRARKGASLSPQ